MKDVSLRTTEGGREREMSQLLFFLCFTHLSLFLSPYQLNQLQRERHILSWTEWEWGEESGRRERKIVDDSKGKEMRRKGPWREKKERGITKKKKFSKELARQKKWQKAKKDIKYIRQVNKRDNKLFLSRHSAVKAFIPYISAGQEIIAGCLVCICRFSVKKNLSDLPNNTCTVY